MKYRFLIIVITLLVFVGLIFFPRVIKNNFQKTTPEDKVQSEPKKETIRSVSINSFLKEAEDFEKNGSLLEAKEIYQRVMGMSLSSEQMGIVQSKLEDLNIKILLSGINIEQSLVYEVKPGDVLVNIAKEFNTTVGAIAKANNIDEDFIRPAMKLRILKGEFSIFIDKSQNILILKFNDEVVKTYPVSTGKNNSTPIGTYKIINKIVDPPWYRDGRKIPSSSPENILGSRWLGFDLAGYGIHGTTNPEEISMQTTEGCVRMRNKDVEEIFILVPSGIEITIVD
ncbi:L,D-transpeptidase family protein [bacterium]|nr:L,D-transpeptidase family protein [bacterium]